MIEKNITKEELWHYLFDLETIGMGSYGIIKKIDDSTCIKIYYKDIFDTYRLKDISQLDYEIDIRIHIQKEMNAKFENVREINENDRKKLECLANLGLIKNVVYYKGYKIAVVMEYYKDYVELYNSIDKLNKDEIKIVIKKIRDKLDDLIKCNIFPRDLSSANILINLKTLDIAFIDLDDMCTRCESEEYLQENPKVKSYLILNCKNKFKQIENAYVR